MPSHGADPLLDIASIWRAAKVARGPLAAPGSYVCCRAHGSPIRPSDFSSNFAAFVKRHHLPPGGIHALRHSHATWMVTQNVHPKVISKRLGHASIGIMMDIYADAFEEVGREAAACLDADFRHHVTKDVTSSFALGEVARKSLQNRGKRWRA